MERRPWLPFALMALLASLVFLVAAYEADWWVFRKAPHIYRPTPPPATSSEELFGP